MRVQMPSGATERWTEIQYYDEVIRLATSTDKHIINSTMDRENYL